MAENTTLVGEVTLHGVIEPAEARARWRDHYLDQLREATEMLGRRADDVDVTYWHGCARVHPACEEQSVPVGAAT